MHPKITIFCMCLSPMNFVKNFIINDLVFERLTFVRLKVDCGILESTFHCQNESGSLMDNHGFNMAFTQC